LKNLLQDIVEEPTTAQMEEETAHNLRAIDVGILAILQKFVCTDGKGRNYGKPVGYFGMSSLEEGAIWHVC
jgi:hypothetical protein